MAYSKEFKEFEELQQFKERGAPLNFPSLINRIVLCELVWALETGYEYPHESVVLALEEIFRTAKFVIEDHQEAWLTLREYQSGSDFADAFIGTVNRRLSCEATFTFDRKASRQSGFRAL